MDGHYGLYFWVYYFGVYYDPLDRCVAAISQTLHAPTYFQQWTDAGSIITKQTNFCADKLMYINVHLGREIGNIRASDDKNLQSDNVII